MTSASALERLLRPVAPLAPGISIADVADRLLTPQHMAFLSLPIVDGSGRPVGLGSRSALQDIFMQRFGRDLRGRHPVEGVMNPAPLLKSLAQAHPSGDCSTRACWLQRPRRKSGALSRSRW